MSITEEPALMPLGYPPIDQDHELLLVAAYTFCTVAREGGTREELLTAFTELVNLSLRHFAFEEDLMRAYHVPDEETHVREHAEIMARARTLCRQVLASNCSADRFEATALFNTWYGKHLQERDQPLVALIPRRQPAVAAAGC
jgi:hemerythrin-like metal-binding protein